MARYINGQPANTPEEKRSAVESAGGTYNENISGNYVQGKSSTGSQPSTNNKTDKPCYVENLDGDHVDGEGNKISDKKSGWFW